MDNILPFVPAVRISSDPGSSLYSDHMLAELLALQEGMIARLHLERLRIADTTDFLTDMIDHFLTGVIDQHEKAAALLRTQLENDPAETTNDGLIIITREDSSDAETFPAPGSPEVFPTILRQRIDPSTSENFKSFMSLKIKSRSTDDKTPASAVEPPMSHDATNGKASANPASRRPLTAAQPASGAANHARHHVSRRTQS